MSMWAVVVVRMVAVIAVSKRRMDAILMRASLGWVGVGFSCLVGVL
jgi:hypothetical protein